MRFKGKSIADVLDMTVEEACVLREDPEAAPAAPDLHDVGVGYLQLDRPAKTLSGGEAQRLRLAAELAAGVGDLYILDEPTTGSTADNDKLIEMLQRLKAPATRSSSSSTTT